MSLKDTNAYKHKKTKQFFKKTVSLYQNYLYLV